MLHHRLHAHDCYFGLDGAETRPTMRVLFLLDTPFIINIGAGIGIACLEFDCFGSCYFHASFGLLSMPFLYCEAISTKHWLEPESTTKLLFLFCLRFLFLPISGMARISSTSKLSMCIRLIVGTSAYLKGKLKCRSVFLTILNCMYMLTLKHFNNIFIAVSLLLDL